MIAALVFIVAAGVGTTARRVLSERLPRPRGVPLGTLVANVSGAVALGLLASWSGPAATVVGVGGLGATTTFSTFAGELVPGTTTMTRPVVAAYLAASLVLGIGGAFVGLQLA